MEAAKKKKDIWVSYVLLFILFSGLFLAYLSLKGRTLIHTADPFDQDYPIFLYMGKLLRKMIMGQGITLYDFSVGLGENVIAPLNLYGFGDPLNVFSVFATEKSAEMIYTILLLIRLFLAGVGMLLFFGRHGHKSILCSAGALLYVFSLFSIVRGLHFYSLLSTMYLFPFLLIELEKIILQKRPYKAMAGFAALIGIQTSCSFYFLYMQTIFLLGYGLFFYFSRYKKGQRGSFFLQKIFCAGIAYLTGILMAGIVLFPTLKEFFNSSRSAGGITQGADLLFSLREMGNFAGNLLIPMIQDDNYGLGISCFSVMALVLFFMSREYERRKKLLALLMLLAYACPAFWSMTNGFSYVSDRWTYVIYFATAYLTVAVLEGCLEKKYSKKELLISALVCTASIFLHLFLNGDKIRSAVYFLLLLISLAVLIKERLQTRRIFMAVVLANIGISLMFLLAPWQLCGHDIWKSFCGKEEIGDLTAKLNGEDYADGFERQDVKGQSRGESLAAGYYGTTEYFSILNKNTFRFWDELMISPGICAEPHHLEGLDGRAPLEALLSVSEYQNGNEILTNGNALPLGIQYANDISEEQFQTFSPLQKQKLLLERIVVEDGEKTEVSWEPTRINCEIIWNNIMTTEGGFMPSEDASIELRFDRKQIGEGKGELYVLFEDFQCLKDDFSPLVVGEHQVLIQNRESKYFTGAEDYLVHANAAEDGTVTISVPYGNEYLLNDISVWWYDYEGMTDSINALKQHTLQNLQLEGNTVKGEINAANGWLFFSIPYNSDWKVYVDNKKEQLVRANVGFMAVYLEEGMHSVRLEYRPRWFYAGALCTLLGLAFCGGLCLYGRKHEN